MIKMKSALSKSVKVETDTKNTLQTMMGADQTQDSF